MSSSEYLQKIRLRGRASNMRDLNTSAPLCDRCTLSAPRWSRSTVPRPRGRLLGRCNRTPSATPVSKMPAQRMPKP
eukprot:2348265-Prymnesium_polylepis.1